ncbi:MAG: 30S ribosomal protein S8 [archaeon]
MKSYEVSGEKKTVLKIQLSGAINKIGAIKPRYPITLLDYERYELRYLPAKDFGRIIVSTSKGVMTHIDAKAKKLGGVLLAFVY